MRRCTATRQTARQHPRQAEAQGQKRNREAGGVEPAPGEVAVNGEAGDARPPKAARTEAPEVEEEEDDDDAMEMGSDSE